MNACATQTFSNISAEKWQAIQTKVSEKGIAITGDSGQSSRDGFTFSWRYDASSATLTIQCLEHPFLASCGMVNGRVHDLIDAV